jgi:hypothetical protein
VDSRLIMNGYIFDIHINCCFVLDNQVDDEFKYDLLEVGPLNMISFDVLNKVRAVVRSISSSPVPLNWWTEFSSWQDFRALLRTGSRLSIHTVVENLNQQFEAIENADAYVETIDENGNIEVELSESTDELLQAFTIRAKRKKLRSLKDVAAYSVAQYLSCNNDVKDLQVPISLKKLVKPFVITFSGDYIFDLNEN